MVLATAVLANLTVALLLQMPKYILLCTETLANGKWH